MLHTQTVEPSTLGLLRSLQSKDYLKGFNRVGGTALALYLGHRTSIDIDLSDWPVLLREPHLKWADVCKRIETEVLLFMKEFS